MMLVWIIPVTAVLGVGLTAIALILTRRDRFGDHWRTEAAALLDENERLRQRLDDLDHECAEKLAALRVDNDMLGKRIIALVRAGGGAP